MGLPPLDIPTLFVVAAMVIAFSGSVLIVARGRDEGATSLAIWGAAMLLGAAGIVLLSMAPMSRTPAHAAGNVAILIGVALSWTGARAFSGRQPRLPLMLAGVATWLAIYSLPWGSASAVPGICGFLIGGLYTLAAAAELWRGRAEALPSRNAATVLLLAHAAVYLVQATGNAVSPATFSAPPLVVFLILEALLHTTGMAFLFLALMKERAELRSTLRLQQLALRDGLTGLGNRRCFDQVLADQLHHAIGTGTVLGLLMIDVDQFKAYNDTYGHQAGDDCLRALATAMNATVHRAGDLVVRYGGEEFAVLLPGADDASAAAVAERIRTRVEALGIVHAASLRGVVTVSIGVACHVPQRGTDEGGALLRAADKALYGAKASGRNASRSAARSFQDVRIG